MSLSASSPAEAVQANVDQHPSQHPKVVFGFQRLEKTRVSAPSCRASAVPNTIHPAAQPGWTDPLCRNQTGFTFSQWISFLEIFFFSLNIQILFLKTERTPGPTSLSFNSMKLMRLKTRSWQWIMLYLHWILSLLIHFYSNANDSSSSYTYFTSIRRKFKF